MSYFLRIHYLKPILFQLYAVVLIPVPFPQVCEERLQFSLSENVKSNVLWGATVSETVTIRPWGEQTTDDSGDPLSVKDNKDTERFVLLH